MAKGRKSIPNEMKRARGTDQPVRMGKEVKTEKLTKVSVPRILKTTRARKIFRDKSKQLIGYGILTAFDIELLAMYCNSLDMVIQCVEELNGGEFVEKIYKEQDGEMYLTAVITNPYVKIYKDLLDQVNRIGGDFGFSPVSRLKLASMATHGADDSDKDFD